MGEGAIVLLIVNQYVTTVLKNANKMNEKTVIEFLLARKWTFAKTMPNNPHEWIAKEREADPKLFERVAEWIQQNGEAYKHWKTTYSIFIHEGYRYWTMGNPPEMTRIINRAKHE